MEISDLQHDSEWPADSLPLRWEKELLITSASDKGTVFVADAFGNVILPDQDTYRMYEQHLAAQEAQRMEGLEAA